MRPCIRAGDASIALRNAALRRSKQASKPASQPASQRASSCLPKHATPRTRPAGTRVRYGTGAPRLSDCPGYQINAFLCGYRYVNCNAVMNSTAVLVLLLFILHRAGQSVCFSARRRGRTQRFRLLQGAVKEFHESHFTVAFHCIDRKSSLRDMLRDSRHPRALPELARLVCRSRYMYVLRVCVSCLFAECTENHSISTKLISTVPTVRPNSRSTLLQYRCLALNDYPS